MSTLYEDNIRKMLMEKRARLKELEASEKLDQNEIAKLTEEIGALERLYENYVSNMGAFRRTKGTRIHT
ncbi:MAG: hypothetical protein QW416_00170 [Candidatus Nitrosocaldaceae archaeon]